MECHATFTVKTTDQDKLKAVFAAEDKALSNDRASYTLQVTTEGITVDVVGKDAVAFRAMVNAVSKVLAIYEKMLQVN
jgi:tRNA threonylcarbamoyladenosine modification (KEOPS) complex  Pcc1 subunit